MRNHLLEWDTGGPCARREDLVYSKTDGTALLHHWQPTWYRSTKESEFAFPVAIEEGWRYPDSGVIRTLVSIYGIGKQR